MIEKFIYSTHTIFRLFGFDSFDFSSKVETITNSSLEIKKNSLFIPLIASRDGHDFIEEAFEKGASLALSKKNHPILKKISKSNLEKIIQVDDTLLALGKLASFHRSRFNPFVIGITGSSGKTTTKELFSIIFLEFGAKYIVYTEKNFNNEIGVPFTLFKINSETKLAIIEMGMNHKTEISRLTKIACPDIGFITNIGPCHIENLGSIENIAKAKAEIMEGMKKKSVLFIPDEVLNKEVFINKAKSFGIQLKKFSLKKSKLIKLKKQNTDGFELEIFDKKFNWNLAGIKILENLSGVLEAMNYLKFDKEKILNGLKKFKAKDKRMVIEKNQFHVINDTYNANPDSMISSILATEQLSDKKDFVLILGDMKELGKFSKFYHEKIGEFIDSTNAYLVISYGDDSKWIIEKIKTKQKKHFPIEEIKDLILFVEMNVKKNSFILVKGSRSMKMEKIVEGLRDVK